MFSLTLEQTEFIRILKSLQDRIGLFPFEIKEDGIDIATMDDGRNMAIWIHFPLSMFSGFEFGGEETERYMIPSDAFTKAAASTKYPIEITSLMDGSIKMASNDGRQTYKLIPERGDVEEETEYHRNRFNTVLEEREYTTIKILKQDLLEAVRTVQVASEQARLVLEENALLFSAVDAIIEADGVAPLVESVENPDWSHPYELKLLKFFLEVPKDNVEIVLHLLGDSDSFLVEIPFEDGGFCKMAVAAIPVRGEE